LPSGSSSCSHALGRFDARLAAAFPRRSIVASPTPVQPLEKLSRSAGGAELWIKRDDLTNPRYGGNKPRKLEFLIGDALVRGARGLLTFGVVGSHHALATAIFGHEAGLSTTAVLVKGPLHPHAVENLRRTCAEAERVLLLDVAGFPAVASAVLGALTGGSLRTCLIPPGGSSVIGNLGYVAAAMELAEQVRAGEMPRPDYIFVPAGSLGTIAGLVTGLALARLETWTAGIAVLGPPSATQGRVDSLVRRVRRRILDVAPDLKSIRTGFERFSLFFDQLGQGYGHETEAGARAARQMQELEGITLDTTYTAKTVAGMLDRVGQPSMRGKTVLYWHTLSSAPPPALDGPAAPLPPAFERLLAVTG